MTVQALLAALGALSGLLGVALSAMARHRDGLQYLETVAQFLLFHAPALFGLAALLAIGVAQPRIGAAAGIALVIGLALFCGDLAARDFLSGPLFPMAAPTGGTLLMIGWLLIGIAALWPKRP
jgi:uncharacterized membrane protein YgdD (TMEM256/DUF423 family)